MGISLLEVSEEYSVMTVSVMCFAVLYREQVGPTEEEDVQELYLKAVRFRVIGGFLGALFQAVHLPS